MTTITYYKSKSGKGFITVILIIILALILCALIMLALACQDDNTDKYNSTPSYEPAETLAVNALMSNEAVMSESELNSLFAYCVQNVQNNGAMNEDFELKAIYLELHETTSRLYIQINYNGRDFGFSSDVNIYLDSVSGQICLDLSNTAVGKLKIPRSVLLYALNKTNANSSGIITTNDTTICLPSDYSITVDDVGTLVNVNILELDVNEGEIYVKTNPIAEDIVNNVLGILGDKIYSYLDGFGDLF